MKDDPILLKISSDSIRNENKDVLLFKNQTQNSKTNYLVNEYFQEDNSLCYDIGPTKINTMQNTVNDLLNHFELAKKITKTVKKIK